MTRCFGSLGVSFSCVASDTSRVLQCKMSITHKAMLGAKIMMTHIARISLIKAYCFAYDMYIIGKQLTMFDLNFIDYALFSSKRVSTYNMYCSLRESYQLFFTKVSVHISTSDICGIKNFYAFKCFCVIFVPMDSYRPPEQ